MERLAPVYVQSEPKIKIAAFMDLVVNVLCDGDKPIYECNQYPRPSVCFSTNGVRNDVTRRITFGYDMHQKRFYETAQFMYMFPNTDAFKSRLYTVIVNYMVEAQIRGRDYFVAYKKTQLEL